MIGNFRLPMQGAATASTSSPMVWSQAYYDNIYANSYTRPSDWLTLPTVLSTDQKIVMLHAVYDHDANFCALQCASNYTVNWGDGVVENFAANVSAYHIFNYANHAGTESTREYRQAIVTVTPQPTFNLTKLDLNIKHNQAGLSSPYTAGWLDIRMAGSLISTLTIGSASTVVNHRNLEQFDFIGTNAVTTGNNLFNSCFSLCKVVNLYTNGFTSMQSMFSLCYSLQTIPLLNTASVINMAYMFYSCNALLTIPLLNTQAVTTMSNMFSTCTSLQTIPLLSTANVIDMQFMFYLCRSLQTIPLINTIKVSNMSGMFSNGTSLQNIPLLNTVVVTNMSGMFTLCTSLQTIPLLNTAAVINMSYMFQTCTSLQTIPLINTIKVNNMSTMFQDCYSLQTIPLLNTAAVTTMTYMFQSCISLQTIPLLITSAVTDMSSMFQNCSSLQTVPLLNTALVNNIITMFGSCQSLQIIPALNANSVIAAGRLGTIFSGDTTISKIALTNIRITLSIASLKLSAPAIIEVFNNLVTTTGQTLTISGNWGTASLTAANRLIATNKGWTLVG